MCLVNHGLPQAEIDKMEAAARRFHALPDAEKLKIKVGSASDPVATLSGGNQQKVVLARWLATQPALLILDEPTRGIDIAAKEDLMRAVAELAGKGMAVLFISAEIREVLRVSDRVVVMRERRKVGELPGDSDEHAVYALIAEEA